MTRFSSERKERLRMDLHSKQAVLKRIDSELKERSLGIIKLDKGTDMWNVNENKINELSQQKQELDKEIDKLIANTTDPKEDGLNIEDFLNLSKNASRIVQSANAIVKDQICRLIFLNLTVNEEKVVSYQAKEPFATLLKMRSISTGRDDRTRTCDLLVPNEAF